ncbi:MAG: class I SAM-dependent methyltransferase [Bryobacteraceae bacterium]|jgi:ubiquinone/menaquinone biosynthesis C-methylase UbiE
MTDLQRSPAKLRAAVLRFSKILCGLVVGCALVFPVWSQVGTPGSHPVTGREYARPMSADGADWLSRSERDEEEQPRLAIDALNIPEGATVADIGAGSGYITALLARRVGPRGKVYANDIQVRMLDLLRRYIAQQKLTNVEPVLGAVDDPKLPANTIDLALMVDVYHEFSEPQKMLRGIRRALKADGRMALIEYRGEDPSIPIRPEHKMTVVQVRAEIEPEEFRFVKTIETLPRQHIIIFVKQSGK